MSWVRLGSVLGTLCTPRTCRSTLPCSHCALFCFKGKAESQHIIRAQGCMKRSEADVLRTRTIIVMQLQFRLEYLQYTFSHIYVVCIRTYVSESATTKEFSCFHFISPQGLFATECWWSSYSYTPRATAGTSSHVTIQ